jgi:mRNA interferase MazF
MEVVDSRPQLDEVWLVELDPVIGSEMQKTRPCLVVSPDETNEWLRTVIVAPMTSVIRTYPTRVAVTFQGKRGQIALDQIRTVDQSRLVRRLGTITAKTARTVSDVLIEMFRRPDPTSAP